MGQFQTMKELNIYHDKLCANCENYTQREHQNSEGCPIIDKHINQTMVNLGHEEWQEENQETLDTFIPVINGKEKTVNKKCIMFLPKE